MRSFFQFLVLIFSLVSTLQLAAQSEYYRYKSEFSIKEKEAGQDQGRLIMGTVYFDKNQHKTLYNIRFPEPEQWLIRDTLLYRKKADTLVAQQVVPPVGEFSIFNLILSQQLQDFGLAKMGYTPGTVQQDGEQVISSWLPPEKLKAYLGEVSIAQENKRLVAVAFYDKAQKLGSKFYFKDYSIEGGLPVPGKIYQIFYRETGEFIRIMTLKNILINQTDEDILYDFVVPADR